LSQVSHVAFMRDGRIELFGPRDEVLAKISNKPVPLRAAPPPDGTLAAKEA
jgi:ATP-binding cassette subfamily C protein